MLGLFSIGGDYVVDCCCFVLCRRLSLLLLGCCCFSLLADAGPFFAKVAAVSCGKNDANTNIFRYGYIFVFNTLSGADMMIVI